ncbi:hypothetical protein [Caldifermentibacillus hisashii]|uniref:hypothetical protein n=1 Tax=Caldifermentibacillus hisashii TaxID=996558 RepID=UPI0030E9B8ED
MLLGKGAVLVVVFVRKSPLFGDVTRSRRRFEAENSTFLATRPFLVVVFVRKTHFFGDEITSRRHFWAGNSTFWRRNSFSSSFLRRKLLFLATRAILVVVFAPESPLFGDDTPSRRRFETENAIFWRRDHFSSSLLGGKLHFLVTILVLVVVFVRKSPFFGNETRSRRHFGAGNAIFWRRNSFSSSFWGRKLHFLATILVLVVFFRLEMLFFGDETLSRRLFEAENSLFWRRDHFSSSLLDGEPTFLATTPLLVVVFAPKTPFFGDETPSRRHFVAENSLFWRRHPFSSSFLCGNLHFLATTPFLVVVFVRKSPLFGDETLSRRRFCAGNFFFWRRHPLSSSFLCGNLHFLVTRPFLVVFLRRKTHFFGDEITSRRHFWAGNSIFWRRNSFSSSFLGWKCYFLASKLLLIVFLGPETPLFGDETLSRRHFEAENPLFWRRHPFSSSLLDGEPTFLATKPLIVVAFGRRTHFFGDETFSSSFLCVNKYTNSRFSAFDCL